MNTHIESAELDKGAVIISLRPAGVSYNQDADAWREIIREREKDILNTLLTFGYSQEKADYIASDTCYEAVKRFAVKVVDLLGCETILFLKDGDNIDLNAYITTPTVFYAAQFLNLYSSSGDELTGLNSIWETAFADFKMPEGQMPDAKTAQTAYNRVLAERRQVIWTSKLERLQKM